MFLHGHSIFSKVSAPDRIECLKCDAILLEKHIYFVAFPLKMFLSLSRGDSNQQRIRCSSVHVYLMSQTQMFMNSKQMYLT